MNSTDNVDTVKSRIILNNGYLLKLLHEHMPSLQVYGSNKKNKIRWNSLAFLIKLIDYQLSHSFDDGTFELSQEEKRKEYLYSDEFSDYLHLHFYESIYEKKIKVRNYSFREHFKNIIYKCTNYILENDFNKLFEKYSINTSEPKLIKYYPDIKFSNSLFYDEFDFNMEQHTLTYGNGGDNLTEKFKKTRYFDSMKKSNVCLTTKKDARKIYSYSQRNYEALEKCDKDVLTLDFKKARIKIKKNNTKAKLEKYINTNLILDTEKLKEIIKNIIKLEPDNIFNVFPIINILNRFSEGDNYILYEVGNFRYLSKKELNNKINFQAIKKEYRKYIFVNQYDYDINAGAPTLLYQYIKRVLADENIKLEYLERYIENRNIVRDESARLLKEKYPDERIRDFKKEVKAFITAALYGSNILNKESKVEMRLLDRDYLYDNYEEFRNLIGDVKKLFKYYEEYLEPFFEKNHSIEMPNGNIELFEIKDEKRIKKKLASVVSGFYFSLETQILKLVYDNYKEHISLLIHDGFIARIDIDTDVLEKLVKDNLGYDVKYEKKQLL